MKRGYELNTRGHVWQTDEDGDIDIFGHESDPHNGPVCVKCGYGFCHHCHELPELDCTGEPNERL